VNEISSPANREDKHFDGEYAEMCALSLEDLSKQLKTDPNKGLSGKDAEDRLVEFGPNMIPRVKPSFYKVWIAPFMNLLITIFLVVSVILLFFAIFILPEAGARLFIWIPLIGINAALAVVQQARAQRKLEALQKLSAPKCEVLRDHKIVEIPSEQVVPGDILKLERGDRIPADARIITASSLRVNEAALTGESNEVEKTEVDLPVDEGAPIHAIKNMVFLGTYVTAGLARALVMRTGKETQLGRISTTLGELDTGEIPLRQKVNRLAKYLGVAVIFYLVFSLAYNMIVLQLANGIFAGGVFNTKLVSETIVRSLQTAMTIMPINIPLLTTIILLTGILAMVQHHVLIRDLSAVESLGRISVVCSDKTGTITKNEMTARWICLPSADLKNTTYGVTGAGNQPSGEVMTVDPSSDLREVIRRRPEELGSSKVQIEPETSLECVLASGMLDNESSIIKEKVKISDREQEVYKASGNATDVSLLVLFQKSGLDEKVYKSRFKEQVNYPFESKLKRTTRVFKDSKNGKYVIFSKGATEVLLPRCSRIAEKKITEAGLLRDKDKTLVDKKVDLFASSGYRVISFAFKYLNELPTTYKTDREQIEKDLTYLGFVAIMDPPREGVLESVTEAKNAGIKPIMITGDSVETARSIAQEVGIADKTDLAVEGREIDSLSDKQFLKTSVFARVSPENKMTIVERYKDQKRVVAMTGDGVNDALAISRADVGIATGITGTDVAKQAAGMIITDDSFTSIISGIREGRGLFEKIRAIIFFYIAVNFAEALIYFGSALIPGFYLLNQWQQIYIFATVHSIPPFAIIISLLDRDVMKEKPRDGEGIFNKRLAFGLVLFSIALASVFYIVYFSTLNGVIPLFAENQMGYIPRFGGPASLANPLSWDQAKARTMLHSVAIVAEAMLVISLIRINKPFHKALRGKDRVALLVLILSVPIAHVILMYIPAIQLFLLNAVGINLEIIQLTWIDWLIVMGFAFFPILLFELYKGLVRKLGRFF